MNKGKLNLDHFSYDGDSFLGAQREGGGRGCQ